MLLLLASRCAARPLALVRFLLAGLRLKSGADVSVLAGMAVGAGVEAAVIAARPQRLLTSPPGLWGTWVQCTGVEAAREVGAGAGAEVTMVMGATGTGVETVRELDPGLEAMSTSTRGATRPSARLTLVSLCGRNWKVKLLSEMRFLVGCSRPGWPAPRSLRPTVLRTPPAPSCQHQPEFFVGSVRSLQATTGRPCGVWWRRVSATL
mmetsp:Transcript_15653/g.35570  ORF Transcript_15653/g.35570 Transcript_15653/m.35570 type:complete len:207 (+) Transcript_15653:88-708(+)